MKYSFIRFVIVPLIFVPLSTFLYINLHKISNEIDLSIILDKYRVAFEDGAIHKNDYPYLASRTSIKNLSGIDQYTECFYALMAIYNANTNIDDVQLEEALNPGYFSSKNKNPTMCEQAYSVVFSSADELTNEDNWEVEYKPRLWHGAKVVLLNMLPHYHLSQIHWLIKISTYFGLALTALLVMYYNSTLGLAFIPYILTAYFCSSILFFGGVAYSVPLLSAIVSLNIWIIYRLIRSKSSIDIVQSIILVLGGTLNAFFYQLDGSLIYAFSMIVFVGIFMSSEGFKYRILKSCFAAVTLYAIGFFGSILFKHFLLVYSQGSLEVVHELLDAFFLRMSSANDVGKAITPAIVISKQFLRYTCSAYGIDMLYNWVQFSKTLFWFNMCISLLLLIYFKYMGQNQLFEKHSIGIIGFLLMTGVVFLRYAIMQNHSIIHVCFVNRYLFVFAGSVYFYSVWLILSLAYKKTLTRNP